MSYRVISSDITNSASKELARWSSNIHSALKRGYNNVANQFEVDAHRRVPNDTGELVQSYKKDFLPDGLEIGYDVEYASYQELGEREDGSHKIENRPAGGETGFMRKTLEVEYDKYVDMLRDSLLE